MDKIDSKYRPIPFWSWNDELEPEDCAKQIDWMHENGIGGFFMHARGGLMTPYLGEKWFKCVEASVNEAVKLGMNAYAYDENGWPSGFAGGKLLEDEDNRDRYLEYSIGPADPKAFACYDISGEKLVRVKEGDNVLNLYKRISPSTVDICNPEVIQKFIKITHEEYKKRDNGGLRGFFTDEPQYFRWGHPYTEMLPAYFKSHYGVDIVDQLGLVFVEKEGYREFRYRYWKAMQDMMLHSFSEQIYNWCDKNNYLFTGHYVEETTLPYQMNCCAGIMPMYEYEHIPGVDWLGRFCPDVLSPKQVGSVAQQLGKKQVITEDFACSGWDVTPIELKRNTEALYWGGVNLLCQHLLPYAEYGQRKRDYPAHYVPLNGWIKKGFKTFNDYVSYLGEFLASSSETPKIAVLQPIRSVYFDFKRNGEWPYLGVEAIEKPFQELIAKLTAMHVSWHLVDETLLAKHGSIKDSSLVCGERSYDILVLPKLFTMDASTEKLISEFVSNGGKLCLPYGLPDYLEGQQHSYPWKGNIALPSLAGIDGFTSNESEGYRVSWRKDKDGKDYIYLVNVGEEVEVSFAKEGMHSFDSYDVETKTTKKVPLSFKLEKGGSRILYFSKDECEAKKPLEEIHLPSSYKLAKKVDNFLTLDRVSYSFNGKDYTDELYHLDAFADLLKSRYKGTLYVKYNFEVKDLPSKCELEVENPHLLSIALNGKELSNPKASEYEKTLSVYDACSSLKVGQNEVILKMDYFQKEEVYYALFGENVTESLRNCLVYDSNIEPIYLKGDFGVYGDFAEGKDPTIAFGKNFYIGKQKTEICRLIEDGFPFFHGELPLLGTLEASSKDSELVVTKRFQMLDLAVNGKKVDSSMFDYRFDLSKYLHEGNNELALNLVVSPRNCMGPHHNGEEDLGVGPYSFEDKYRKDGNENPEEMKTYCFVRTII